MAKDDDYEYVSVINESIPKKYRQQKYHKDHGCVWLSSCLLDHSVDKNIADNMIELNIKDEAMFL